MLDGIDDRLWQACGQWPVVSKAVGFGLLSFHEELQRTVRTRGPYRATGAKSRPRCVFENRTMTEALCRTASASEIGPKRKEGTR
jgi:hypothetical protein